MRAFLVSTEMVVADKGLTTSSVRTYEGSFSSVCANMFFESTWATKRALTAVESAAVNVWAEDGVVVVWCGRGNC
jgi:hypothetical protein